LASEMHTVFQVHSLKHNKHTSMEEFVLYITHQPSLCGRRGGGVTYEMMQACLNSGF